MEHGRRGEFRKVAVPVPDGASWDAFCGQVGLLSWSTCTSKLRRRRSATPRCRTCIACRCSDSGSKGTCCAQLQNVFRVCRAAVLRECPGNIQVSTKLKLRGIGSIYLASVSGSPRLSSRGISGPLCNWPSLRSQRPPPKLQYMAGRCFLTGQRMLNSAWSSVLRWLSNAR